jgi:hypothetical protein
VVAPAKYGSATMNLMWDLIYGCAPGNMVASTIYGCDMVAPPHIIWLHHLGQSEFNVGPHTWLRNLFWLRQSESNVGPPMVAQPKYGCATMNPM